MTGGVAVAVECPEVPTVAQTTKKKEMTGTILALVISAVGVISGVAGGLVGSVATASQWKGEFETRVKNLENQRLEDKRDIEYVRTQNEVIGRDIAAIKAVLIVNPDERRLRRP